jgi:hypothetical protein
MIFMGAILAQIGQAGSLPYRMSAFQPGASFDTASEFCHSRESGNPEGEGWTPAFAGVTTLETLAISPAVSSFAVFVKTVRCEMLDASSYRSAALATGADLLPAIQQVMQARRKTDTADT